jgi:hypothetical protein
VSRKRGRRSRQYRVRVRTLRRDPMHYDALARAALEHAAMQEGGDTTLASPDQPQRRRQALTTSQKEPRHDRLA